MTGAATTATAETLTVVDCLSQAAAEALASAHRLKGAIADTTQGIPAAALAESQATWNAAFSQILEIPIGAMFKSASLRLSVRAPETAVADGPDAVLIALLPFVIESSHHPTIVATCAGVAITLRFDVELSLEVSGAQLRIEKDRIVGARAGTTKGVLRISYLNLDPPFEIGTPEFELPGDIRFSRPAPAEATVRGLR